MKYRTKTLLSCLILIPVLNCAYSQNHYGRGYTIINPVEITNADLSQTINVSVKTNSIGQGLEVILRNTGWRLERGAGADPRLHRLLSGPWPDKWTWIGPDNLGNVLQAIGGQGWQLVIDPVNRLVSYEVNPRLINNKITPRGSN